MNNNKNNLKKRTCSNISRILNSNGIFAKVTNIQDGIKFKIELLGGCETVNNSKLLRTLGFKVNSNSNNVYIISVF